MNSLKIILFFCATFIATTSGAHDGGSLDCPKICPDMLDPICATDGFEYLKFENHCEMDMFNCKRRRSALSTYGNTDMDWCTTTELKNNLQLFPEDLQNSEALCMKPCPLILKEVCGSNGTYRKSFSNECEMETFNCVNRAQRKSEWRLLKKSSCSN